MKYHLRSTATPVDMAENCQQQLAEIRHHTDQIALQFTKSAS